MKVKVRDNKLNKLEIVILTGIGFIFGYVVAGLVLI